MRKISSLVISGITLLFILAACGSPQLPGEGQVTPIAPGSARVDVTQDNTEHRFGVPVTWDAEFVPPPCAMDDETPFLDDALEIAGLDRQGFGFTRDDLLNSPDYAVGRLRDGHPLLWYEKLIENPAYAGCFEGEVVGAIKHHYLNSQTPISDIIRDAAMLLGSDPDTLRINAQNASGDFDGAISVLCATAGGCDDATGEIPPDLKGAITPLLYAISLGVQAKQRMDATIGEHHDAEWWRKYGGNLLMIGGEIVESTIVDGNTEISIDLADERPDIQNDEDRAYILDKSGTRKELYRTAANIAHAVEAIDWTSFINRMGVEFDLYTEAGWIQIRDGADHTYLDDGKDILLRIDLGGNDTHTDPVAVNTSSKNAVSIHIDLAGDDTHIHESAKTSYDRDELLPADKYGRFWGDDRYGNISLSHGCRQGAGLNATAMLFDFGEGDDHYQSLRCSQGYTHGGVGTVFDGGGDNTFLCEAACQASAQFGISIRLIKGQGANFSSSFTNSQGFGYVQGIGMDISGTGDDTNICDPGDPTQDGTSLYYTPQLPGKGNSSFCQGAGLGHRGEGKDGWKAFLAGGFGLKLDLGGNNAFVASVFSQGVGYWQGTGVLDVQGKGDNTFDALWYGQGAAAHHAIGMLFRSGEGKDIFNGRLKPVAIMLGAGHDFSAGIFINDAGNATLHIPLLSAGAGNCNGLGLFVINRGGNRFIADSEFTSAVANVQCSCAMIPEEHRAEITDDAIDWCIPSSIDTKSASLMLLVGEGNEYEYRQSSQFTTPGDLGEWIHKRNDSPLEYSAGISRPSGETGIHAESNRD